MDNKGVDNLLVIPSISGEWIKTLDGAWINTIGSILYIRMQATTGKYEVRCDVSSCGKSLFIGTQKECKIVKDKIICSLTESPLI